MKGGHRMKGEWPHEFPGAYWMAGYGHVGPEIRALAAICGPSFHLIEP